MVSNPCSILIIKMIPKLYSLSILFISTAIFLEAQKGNRNSGANIDEKEYLFPGTGFFVKNRKPYDESEAKAWFKEAYDLEKKEKGSKSK